jgi:uncharacterized protein YpiB (UPF0302 family)
LTTRIELKEKKRFIKWLLGRYQMKRRESMWILNYLINHDIVLNKTRFVEQVDQTPRGIRIATIGTDTPAFRFYKEGREFEDPEQAFHEVRLNWHTDLYIEVIFQDAWNSAEYLSILEDNPFAKWNDTITDELSMEVDEALERFQLMERKQELLKEIDAALEGEKRESFLSLTKELRKIDERLENSLPHS